MTLRLIGYRFSVYTWAVRMGLAEAGLVAGYEEVDPFDGSLAAERHHPFGRVPVLYDGDFRLYETGAILGYLLPPSADRRRAARARQVASIVDAYLYWPLVRQIFVHGAFRPLEGQAPDPAELAAGLAAAPRGLGALEEIAAEGLVLRGEAPGAAECHLAPMLAYFAEAPAGREMLRNYPALADWFAGISGRASFRATRPDLRAVEEVR